MGVIDTNELPQPAATSARVLVVDDDAVMGPALSTVLDAEGFNVTLADTGTAALQRLMDGEPFDLVLLDVMLPDIDGWSILSRLRATPATARLPIIMLTAMSGERDEVELLAAGADDFLPKPVTYDKLLAHMNALLRRSMLQNMNPLTGLPGNRQVEKFLKQCVQETATFWAAAYLDIDNFKPFNDSYGFLRGDEVLKATAKVLTDAVEGQGDGIFVGNIGGDDFLLGVMREIPRADEKAQAEVRALLERVAAAFDRMVSSFYSQEDLDRGFISAESRTGEIQHYPIMTLSIAVVTNARRLFTHPLEISNAFTSLKRKAKSIPGSSIYFDQRRR